MCGLYYQGLVHDLSKYSPIEYFESVKYYTGSSSPIDECKKANGYSMAWLHHRGRNPHHWEYWMDNFQSGGTPLRIPWKYLLEMFCDFLGAGMAYSKGKNLSEREFIDSEIKWWKTRRKECVMNRYSRMVIDYLFMYLDDTESISKLLHDKVRLNSLKHLYEDKHMLMRTRKLDNYYMEGMN
jgi:hypothetical protein